MKVQANQPFQGGLDSGLVRQLSQHLHSPVSNLIYVDTSRPNHNYKQYVLDTQHQGSVVERVPVVSLLVLEQVTQPRHEQLDEAFEYVFVFYC